MKWVIGLVIVLSVFVVACAPPDPNDCSAKEGAQADFCYFEQMKCSQVEDVSLKDSCIAELAKAQNDMDVCKLIQTSKVQGFCIEQFAEVRNDPELCGTIADFNWRNACYLNLAKARNELSLCGDIENFAQSQDCYRDVSLATNDWQGCTFLDTIERDWCLSTVAKRTTNMDICKETSTLLRQDSCRLRVIKELEEESLCEKILTPPVKKDCDTFFIKLNQE